jgi:hypothetical protein
MNYALSEMLCAFYNEAASYVHKYWNLITIAVHVHVYSNVNTFSW